MNGWTVKYALVTPDGGVHVAYESVEADTMSGALLAMDARLRARMCAHGPLLGQYCECGEDVTKDVWNYWVATPAGGKMWGWTPDED